VPAEELMLTSQLLRPSIGESLRLAFLVIEVPDELQHDRAVGVFSEFDESCLSGPQSLKHDLDLLIDGHVRFVAHNLPHVCQGSRRLCTPRTADRYAVRLKPETS